MKIILVNKFLYPKGGDAVSTLATGRLLSSKGHKVIFWGMQHPLNPEYPYKDYFVSHVDFNNSRGIKNNIKISINMLYSLEAKSKIEKVIKIEKPDIVHLNNFAHQISPSILDALNKYKIPMVMTMHDYKLVCPTYNMLLNGKPCEKCKGGRYYQCFINKCAKKSFSKSLLNAFEMHLHQHVLRLYDLIDIFISPSEFLKSKLEEMGFKGRVKHIPNFAELDEFQPQYTWLENTIVYFGRLSQEKGLLTLIEAIKKINGIFLKIIGDGPMEAILKEKVRNENIKNIYFLGYKSGEDLKEEIRKIMFVVFPSECYENNPYTVIESFALGKPVIGSRMGGIPELVKENETGLLFDPSNSDDLSLKIEYLRNNPNEIMKMGRNARAFVELQINAENHYQKLMELYNQAINHNKRWG